MEPTYPQLQLLLNQIKVNASSMQSDLGGGINDHLGLNICLEDYEEVSPTTTYKIPLMPTLLRIPSNMKIHETQCFAKTVQGKTKIVQRDS